MMTRRALLVLGAALAAMLPIQAQTSTAVGAARRLIDATPAAQRTELLQPFTEAARGDWHYTPRSRAGVAWKAMSAAQRDATTALLRTALNDRGVDKVRALMALEITLRELEGLRLLARSRELRARALRRARRRRLGLAHRGPSPVAALQPRRRALRGDAAAVLRRQSGGRAARRRRRRAAQRARAVFDARPYGDIVSRNVARAQPLDAVGLPVGEMDAAQQALVLKLIGAFADHLQPELAQGRLARVHAGSLETIRVGWAGSTQPREPHYFRIQVQTS